MSFFYKKETGKQFQTRPVAPLSFNPESRSNPYSGAMKSRSGLNPGENVRFSIGSIISKKFSGP